VNYQGPPAQGGGGCYNQGGRYHQGQRTYNNNYQGGGRGYQYQNQAPPQNYFQNQPKPPDQLVVYNLNNNPGAAGRTQSDHRNDTLGINSNNSLMAQTLIFKIITLLIDLPVVR
jgi:hypothetical protein